MKYEIVRVPYSGIGNDLVGAGGGMKYMRCLLIAQERVEGKIVGHPPPPSLWEVDGEPPKGCPFKVEQIIS